MRNAGTRRQGATTGSQLKRLDPADRASSTFLASAASRAAPARPIAGHEPGGVLGGGVHELASRSAKARAR
jgi:hypothetical protein